MILTVKQIPQRIGHDDVHVDLPQLFFDDDIDYLYEVEVLMVHRDGGVPMVVSYCCVQVFFPFTGQLLERRFMT